MDNYKIGILEPDGFSENAIKILSNIGHVEMFNGDSLENFLTDKDVIFIRLQYYIGHELLKNSLRIKYICSPTTGLNHIAEDLEATIVSLKGETDFLNDIRATSEHIFGLSISLLRNYKHAFINNEMSWNRDKYRGYEIFQSKIGIIGMGRIGKRLVEYYKAFDAEVCFYDIDKSVSNDSATKCESVEEVIANSDIVILSASYSQEYSEFFNKKYFDLMSEKYFINASRGELVNELDFIEYIDKGDFKGIAVDVFSNETNLNGKVNKIIEKTREKNVIVTPHIGGATFTSMCRTEEFVAMKLLKLVTGDYDVKRE